MANMSEIKLLLRQLRQQKDLSQEELARALNLSRQSIISLERGEYLPSSPVLLALLEYFNCPIEQLVEGINITYLEEDMGRGIQLIPLSPFDAMERMRGGINTVLEESFDSEDGSVDLDNLAGKINIYERPLYSHRRQCHA